MTPRRDIELKGETAAFSIAGTALGEAATSRRPTPRTRSGPARAPPRRECAAPPPDGARDRAIVMAERRLRGGLEAVVAAIIEAASSGDMAAARLVVDRLLPAPRDRRISFALRPIACADDAIKASADILAAVAQGTDHAEPKPRRSRNCCIISSRRASCASSNAGWRRSRRRPRNAHESARPPLEAPRSARAPWPWAR